MKNTIKKDFGLWIIILLPIAYLASIWQELPQKLPMHWNYKGEIDRYGDKFELLWISLGMPLGIYLIFLLVPIIDPKKSLDKMGKKYQSLKFLLTAFMSILALYIIYISKNQSLGNPNYIVLIIGALFMLLGNYFKTIQPNYFIGIRTPWTLESKEVWRTTHNLAGKLWFVGGLVIIILSLMLDKKLNFIIFLSITAIISIVPVVYSYILYKKNEDLPAGIK